MNDLKLFIKKRSFVLTAAVIMLLALICRYVYCHWGYPLRLQPDEHSIVDSTIEMLSRHSWEANEFARPDHFEIKCNAVIFTILSWLKFHKPPYEAFTEFPTYFYLRAKYFTAVFSVALIPLVGVITGKLAASFGEKRKNLIRFFAMFFTAFPELFIENSSYATPDLVLTFFVALFTWFELLYLESGSRKYLIYSLVTIGIGITIKYPAALLALPFAIIFVYREYFCGNGEKKNLRLLPKYFLISIGVVFMTMFIIGPNLFTNVSALIRQLRMEARNYHVGSDGLGFAGNLKYYFMTISSDLGTVSILLFFAGIVYLLVRRKRAHLVLITGLIYWVCLSVLSLHWVRWGIPMYIFYNMIAALGVGAMLNAADRLTRRGYVWKITGRLAVFLLTGVILLNVSLSCLAKVKYSTIPDTRYITSLELPELGITAENSAYESYSPFAPNGSGANADINIFRITESGLKINPGYILKKYYIMTDSYRDRYFAEPVKYAGLCALYDALDEAYTQVYHLAADGNYFINGNILENIRQSWNYLRGNQSRIGVEITVYDLDPKPLYMVLKTPDSRFLSVPAEEMERDHYPELDISEEPFFWVRLDLAPPDTYAMLSSRSGMAADVPSGNAEPGAKPHMFGANGGVPQQWRFVQEDGWTYIVYQDHMALTRDGKEVVLKDFNKTEDQRWDVHYMYDESVR